MFLLDLYIGRERRFFRASRPEDETRAAARPFDIVILSW
jgi:hypothetical protein